MYHNNSYKSDITQISMTLKRIEGKTVFDYFSEEHFKMKCEGYKRISEKQLAAYMLLGSKNYRAMVNDAFKHSCIEAHFKGIFPGDKKFPRRCRKTLERYCLEQKKEYDSPARDDMGNEILFVYSPQTERQMWENTKSRLCGTPAHFTTA
jgi:hypothetical protein